MFVKICGITRIEDAQAASELGAEHRADAPRFGGPCHHGRQLEELAQMLEKEGATIVRCPLVGILDAPDAASVVAWLQELIAGRFSHVILLTG